MNTKIDDAVREQDRSNTAAAAYSVALAEFRREEFQRLVDEEKARLRRQSEQSLWQRLINKLPFTIVWKDPK